MQFKNAVSQVYDTVASKCRCEATSRTDDVSSHDVRQIVLQSMRKYMVQIIVREDLSDVQYVFPLPETVFVAVTQYQNENITRMKITHNPFANGFKYAHVTG